VKKIKFIFYVVLAALVPVIMSCDSRERLYIFNWTYYIPDSVIRQFEEEFNVRVVYDEFTSNEDMFARLLTSQGQREGLFGGLARRFGRQFDLVFPSNDFIPLMMQSNMLQRFDHSLIPNLANLCPVLVSRLTADPAMNYAIPYFYGMGGVLVNTERVPEFEKSWSIFEREDLRGRMTMLDDLRETIGGALAYLGFSVNTDNPEEIIAARDHINTYWSPNLVRFDADAFAKGFANGEFWVVHGFPESVFYEINELPIFEHTVFFLPEEGGPSFVDFMVLLRDARNAELAHKFVDFIHRPEIYAEFVTAFGLPATANVPARELTTGFMFYTSEDMLNSELVRYLDPATFDLYTDAWFNSIRIGQ